MTDNQNSPEIDDLDVLPGLDARARRSAAAATTAAAGFELTMPTGHQRRGTRPQRFMGAAAVLLLLVGVGVFAVTRGDGRNQQSLSGAPLLLFPDHVPTGLTLAPGFARTDPLEPMNPPPSRVYASPDDAKVLVVYGDVSDEFTDGDASSGDSAPVPIGDPANGRQAIWTDDFLNGAPLLHVDLAPQRGLTIFGKGLTKSEMTAVGAAASFDGKEVTVTDGVLPSGLTLLPGVNLQDLLSISGGDRGASSGGSGYPLTWAGKEGLLTLAIRPDDGTRLRASTLLLKDRKTVTVRGHSAVLGHQAFIGMDYATLTWIEDGQQVAIQAGNLSDAEVLAVAASLREVSATEFAELTKAVTDSGFDSPPGDQKLLASGQEPAPWRATAGSSGSCVERRGFSSCWGNASETVKPAGHAFDTQMDPGSPTVLVGSIGSDAARVTLTVDGTTQELELISLEQNPSFATSKLFATALPAGATTGTLVAYRSDGTEMTTSELSDAAVQRPVEGPSADPPASTSEATPEGP